MSSKDFDYYAARASEERALAAAARKQEVATIHLELARKYEALAKEAEAGPTLRAGWGSSPTSQAV